MKKNNKINRNVSVIILAAGLGTRMKSNKAKVLHEICGIPMVTYVVQTAKKIAGDNIILVIGKQAEKVREVALKNGKALFAMQEKQLGTGHAVLCAIPYIPDDTEEVVILCGDVPLITSDTVLRLLNDHIRAKRAVSLLAVEVNNPEGYGRVLFDENRKVTGIVEESDATTEQKRIKMINTGIYCAKKEFLGDALRKIRADNVQEEYYLTDVVEIAYSRRKNVGALVGSDDEEFIGVNTYQELLRVEAIMRERSRNMS